MSALETLAARLRRWIGHPVADEVSIAPTARPAPVVRRAALHVLIDEGLLRLDGGRLALVRNDCGERTFAIHELSDVCVHGRAGVTTPALRALVSEGVPVVWRDEAGRYVAQLIDLSGATTHVRRAQYAAQNDTRTRLALARAFVTAKIVNARGLLRRREIDHATLARLAALADDARAAQSIERLLGLEGVAAAVTFAQWPSLLAKSAFDFPGRRRRPSTDPVNAMLSYAYAFLVGECASAAQTAGLDPYAGFLHAERPGRPALALDLVEPLRSLIAERAVLRVINRGEATPDEFETSDDGVRLSLAARRKLIGALAARLAEAAPGGSGVTYREAIIEETARLAGVLRAGEPYVYALLRA